MIISIFTPHGGCPERCSFCDQRVSGGNPVSARNITATIEAHLNSDSNPANEAAFYGGTFTAMPEARQRAYLDAVLPYLKDGRIDRVRISTRPDAIDENWMTHLRDHYQVRTVELGVQSFEDQALKRLGRTHSIDDVGLAVNTLHGLGLDVGLHLMLGCPEESPDADRVAQEHLARLKPRYLRLHPLLVLKGTVLEKEFALGRYEPLSLEQAIERAATLTQWAEKQGIKVIRLGLQTNELLGEAVVAGPYHPSFGDLVRGRILRRQIEGKLLKSNVKSGDKVELLTPERSVGSVLGPQKANLEWLRRRFDLSLVSLSVVKDAPNHYGEVEIRIHNTSRSSERRQVELTQ